MPFQDFGEFFHLGNAVICDIHGPVLGDKCSSGPRISAVPHDQLLEVRWPPDDQVDPGQVVGEDLLVCLVLSFLFLGQLDCDLFQPEGRKMRSSKLLYPLLKDLTPTSRLSSSCRPSSRSKVAFRPIRKGEANISAMFLYPAAGRWWTSSKIIKPNLFPSLSAWM